jgi:hypothetical protein
MKQDESITYSQESNSKFVDKWENNIEKIEANRKIMQEGAEAVKSSKRRRLRKPTEVGQNPLV